MVKQCFAERKANAKRLKIKYGIEYDKCNVEVMLDGYCDAKDSNNVEDKNLFISGLLLRHQYLIPELKRKSPGFGNDYETFDGWVYEGIEYACKYRKWRDPKKKVNGSQAINQCVNTIRLQHHYNSNLDKHKANFNTLSLEAPIKAGEEKITFMDILEGEQYAEKGYQGDTAAPARELIQFYVDQNKLVEAVILDLIAFNDLEHEVKKTVNIVMENGETKKSTTKYKEFWPFKCVRMLQQLPADYIDYFLKNYKTSPDKMNITLNNIESANNQRLYKYLRNTLKDAQTILASRKD